MNNALSSKNFSVPLSLRLSGSALKIIAVLSMVADHYAYFLMEHGSPLYEAMRCFGRIAFPVFAFLIAEGFANTRNRTRYFLTLFGFALISEIPWFLLNDADGTHNVMFTLTLGVVALAVFDRLCEHGPLCFLSIMLICSIAWWSGIDYDWRGIMMIVILYVTPSDHRAMDLPEQNLLPLSGDSSDSFHTTVDSTLWYDGSHPCVNGNILI